MRHKPRAVPEPTQEQIDAFAAKAQEKHDEAIAYAQNETGRLAPYDPEAVCPKCGSVRVDSEYKPLNEVCGPIGVVLRERWWEQEPLFPIFTAEHILRTCGRCMHTWKERPTDSPIEATS